MLAQVFLLMAICKPAVSGPDLAHDIFADWVESFDPFDFMTPIQSYSMTGFVGFPCAARKSVQLI